MRFLSTFGQLPGNYLNLALAVGAGLTEGIGLALLIPLLEIITTGSADQLKPPFSATVSAFRAIGMPVTSMTLLAVTGALILGSLGLAFTQRYVLARSQQEYARSCRDRFVAGLFAANWEYVSTLSHGALINQLITECNRATKALGFEVNGVACAVQIVIYLAVAVAISWQLMLLTAFFGVAGALVLRPLSRRAKALGERINRINHDLNFHALEALRGLKLVKAAGTTPQLINPLYQDDEAAARAAADAEINSACVYYLLQILPLILTVAILAISSGLLATSYSFALAFVVLMVRLAPRIGQFQQQYQNYLITSPAIRVVDVMIRDHEQHVENLREDGSNFHTLQSEIKFENVTYGFPGDAATALDGISLTIGRNQMVAIVGASGAGKSTLIDVLCGLRFPQTGQVLIDGRSLADMNLRSWRQRLGIVMQDPIIFNDSILNNITLFNERIADQSLHRAISIAHLDDVIAGLPHGLETILREGGLRLSGGERQRVALARALCREPELLILDEATSALDNESERFIGQALESLVHAMTIVVVAHHLSTVKRADLIYVMEGGRIIESGTCESLMTNGGRFAEIHNAALS